MKGGIFFNQKLASIFKFLAVILVTFVFGSFTLFNQTFASETPIFPSCNAPEGSVIAPLTNGDHGIVGDSSSHTGSDIVYSVDSSRVLQCFCNGSSGIQTNWWAISDYSQIDSLEAQGWIYVPTGESWGLSNQAYLAQNLSYTCGGSSNNSNSSNDPGGNGGNGSVSAPVCNDPVPGSTPTITSISQGTNSLTITWTPASNPVSYYLVAYGTQPGDYTFGDPNVGNVTSFTIQGLSGGTTYYVVVRAVNGCKPGDLSNEVSATPDGGIINTPALGFNPLVLGATSSASLAKDITAGIQACGQCLWWPIILADIAALLLYYLLVRKQPFKISRLFVGAAISIVAYIVFLILNKGKVCPDGSIYLFFLSIPCRYFWALDGVVYILISWFTRGVSSSKKS